MLAARKLRLQKVINLEITRIKNEIFNSSNHHVPTKPTIDQIEYKDNETISKKQTEAFTRANNIISTAIDQNLDYVYCGDTFVDLRIHQPL